MASKVPTNLVMFDSPAYGGPYGLNAPLFADIAAAEYEGLWTPLFGVKSASLEINGKMDSLSCQLYGTNVENPLNGYIVTVAGSPAAGDIPTITFNSPNLPNGTPVVVSHTLVSGDTATTAAVALVAAINSNLNLAGLGINASNLAGVITINWPSAVPGTTAAGPSGPVKGNTLVLVATVGGSGPGATIAVTLPTTGIALGSALTALGLTSIGTVIPRYIKARIATLTGTGAIVSGNLQGAV